MDREVINPFFGLLGDDVQKELDREVLGPSMSPDERS